MAKKETPAEAYCRQHGIEPGSFQQSETHARLYGEGDKPGLIEQWQDQAAQAKASINMISNPSLADYVNIPTRIYPEDISQKTDPHSQMKDYDHSLEKSRWKDLGGQGGSGDGIEMGDVDDIF